MTDRELLDAELADDSYQDAAMLVAAALRAIAAAREAGRQEATAEIVAWIRNHPDFDYRELEPRMSSIANAISRGDHKGEKE